nr:hypothetical protein [uncultured Undibacterium sp.]
MTFMNKAALLLSFSLMTTGALADQNIGDMLRALKGLNLSGFKYSIQNVSEEKAQVFCGLVNAEPSFSCQLQTDEKINNKQNVNATITSKTQNSRKKLIEIADKIQAFTAKEKPDFNFSVKITTQSSN